MASASAFKVKCPSCEAMVTIRDPSMAGKKVDCPKCKFRFVIEAPASANDDDADDEAPESAEPKTTKVKKKPGAKKSGSKNKPLPKGDDEPGGEKKKKSNKMIYIGGGIGLLAVILIVVALLFTGGDGSKPAPNKQTNAQPPKKVEEKKQEPETAKKEKDVVAPPVDLAANDITNLLPEDAQWVLRLDGKEFLATPIGGVFFEESSDSGNAFRRMMGFGGNDVDRFVASGSPDGSFFGVVSFNKDIKIDDLRNAMELNPGPKNFKKWTVWTIKSNDLLSMVRDYLSAKVKDWGIPLPKAGQVRTLALSLINKRTLVIGDQTAVDSFLQNNMIRKHQMRYESSVAKVEDPKAKDAKKEDPKKNDPKKDDAKKEDEKPKDPRRSTSNPSFLSVDPDLKIMVNQLDTEKNPVLAYAVKFGQGQRPAANLLRRLGEGTGVSAIGLPESPVVGIIIRRMNDEKLDAVAAIEYPKADEPAGIVQNSSIATKLAEFLAEHLNIPVKSKSGDANARTELFQPKNKDRDRFNPLFPKKDPSVLPPPTPQQVKSTVGLTAVDKYLMLAVDLDWKPVYYTEISPAVRSKVDLLKGEALMMTGRAQWHTLTAGIEGLQKKGTVPPAAFKRDVDGSRFHVPYPPEERVSWMVDMLPYLGWGGLERKVERHEAWYYENKETGRSNLRAASAWIPEFLSPEFPESTWRAHVRGYDLGATHFVGVSGIGADAANYPNTPEYAKKLGVFGYDRQTKFADIAANDGLTNTMFMIQVPPTIQRAWIRGGGSTVQGVPETGSVKPFVSNIAGKRGTYALMADGSIRFISESISDDVFKGLATYKGGEKIDNLDQVAPAEKKEVKLVSPAKEPDTKSEEPKKDDAKKDEKKEVLSVEPRKADGK